MQALKTATNQRLKKIEMNAADAKFANRVIKVTGIVDRVEIKEILDIQHLVLIGTDKNRLQNVRCVFNKKYISDLQQLITGQAVKVQGKFDGSVIDIRMTDCVLVS